MDRFSNDGGCEVGLILNSHKPECLKVEYVLRLGFKASNNEVEYKALLVSLRLTRVVGAKHLHIFSDS